MFYTLLPERKLIVLSGEDAIDFLQGLVSNDVRPLKEGKIVYAAMLSPQGKFLHDFFLVPWQGKIFIDVSAQRASDLLARLKIYRLRSKVELSLDESLYVAAFCHAKPDGAGGNKYLAYHDPRANELGFRAIGKKSELIYFIKNHDFILKTAADYNEFRLSIGIPDTGDMIVEKSLLLECNFEQLHGVDFNKGCYIGQEVTARSKFRGQIRKNFYKITAKTKLPEIGTPINAGEKIIGELRSSSKNIGIAIIYNDEYKKAAEQQEHFFCAGGEITITPTISPSPF